MIDNCDVAAREGPADASRRRSSPTRLVDSTLGDDRDRDRRDRPQHVRRVGLRDRHPQRRRGAPRRSAAATASRSSPARPRRRCSRSATPASRTCAGWACRGRARRSQTVSRPFDLTRDGFVLGEGAGVAVPRGPRARQGARRADLRRGRRLRLGGRRLGHDPADRARHRLGPGDEDGPRAARRAGRRGRPDQPARHVDAARRQARGRGDLDGVRRPRRRATARSLAISGTKSMTGHMMGAAGAFEAFATVMSVAEQCVPGDDQLPRLRPRVRPVGRRRDARRCRSATPSRTTSAWAATTARSSSSATTATDDRARRAGRAGSPRTRYNPVPLAPARRPLEPTHAVTLCLTADPARRAVVTGLGAVMPIGNDFPTYWSNLAAGVTGTRRIQRFDASAFEVRIAAEVLDFDPTTVMDAKMARRMSRFIHFAMAAGKEAVARRRASTSRRWTRSSATGSASSSTPAAAGSSRSSTAPTSTTRRARASCRPFAIPALSGSMARLHAVDGVRPDRSGHDPGRRLRDVGHRLPRRAAADPRPASATSS